MSDNPQNDPNTSDRHMGQDSDPVGDGSVAFNVDDAGNRELFRPEDWFSTFETVQRYVAAAKSANPHADIADWARAGRLDAYAESIKADDRSYPNAILYPRFWGRFQEDDPSQNWDDGNFQTVMFKGVNVKACNVRFRRKHVMSMVQWAESLPPAPKASGGRRRSDLWPEWTAELAQYLHNHGCPDGEGGQGTDLIIEEVEKGLADRGLEGPSRSTVQKTVRAVLDRLRAPETSSN